MNQINDMPPDYGFGLGFDYAVWTANTNITLTNVPWNNDYRDVWEYKTIKELNDYIDRSFSHNVNISNSVYAKINEPIVIDQPFNVASQFNYVRVYNPAQPIKGGDTPKYFYYFIVDVIYSAPNATSIIVQLDVWATYIKQFSFGRCYIESGHIGIANEKQWAGYGREYLTVPEGLDIGANYRVVDQSRRELMVPSRPGIDTSNRSIIIQSTQNMNVSAGTVERPNIKSSAGSMSAGLPAGTASYYFRSNGEFLAFMAAFSDKPWVTRGIVSITIAPPMTRYYEPGAAGGATVFGALTMPTETPKELTDNISNTPFRSRSNIVNAIPPRYRHLKKFFTFPYFAIRISSQTGQQIVLQPEQWDSEHGQIKEMASITPPNSKYGIFPVNYNGTAGGHYNKHINGDGYDRGVYINGLPSVPIVNDGAIMYMAQNAHSIAFGQKSADWSQQRALRGNEASYDNQTAGIAAGLQGQMIANTADQQSVAISNQLSTDSAIVGMLTSTMGGGAGGMTGGIKGAGVGMAMGAMGGVGGLIQNSMGVNANNEQLANRMSANTNSAILGAKTSSGIRDTNKALSDWAANGDYQNAIAGMNAKARDAELTAPSMVGSQGGETFGLLNQNLGWRIDYLMPEQGAINTIGEYWLRYGYAVQRFAAMPNTFSVMSHFTYWKLKETYIRGARVPEWVKQSIRGILEKGVTVWRNPDDMGMIDPAVNRPLPGFTLDGYVPPAPEPEPTPEPPKPTPKKRKKKMIVFSTIDENPATPGNVWALAGTSPGLPAANWIETRNSARANAMLQATGQTNPVGLSSSEFASFRENFREPVSTLEIVGEVG